MSLPVDAVDVKKRIEECKSLQDVESIRLEYLGKKGLIPSEMKLLGKLSIDERKLKGQELNKLKTLVEETVNNQKTNISRSIPLADKFIFQEDSSPFNVTPKGHISLSNSTSNNSSVVMVIGGRYAMQSSQVRPKCILIESPSGIIRSGIYARSYPTSSTKLSSKYNLIKKFWHKKCRSKSVNK